MSKNTKPLITKPKPQFQPKPAAISGNLASKIKMFTPDPSLQNVNIVNNSNIVTPKPRTSIKNPSPKKPLTSTTSTTSTTLQQTLPPKDDEKVFNLTTPLEAVITFDDDYGDDNDFNNKHGGNSFDDDDYDKESLSNSSFYSGVYKMTFPKNSEQKYMFYNFADESGINIIRHNSDEGPKIINKNNNTSVNNMKKSPSKRISKTDDDVFSHTSSSYTQKKYSSCWKSEEFLSVDPVASIENIFDSDANFTDEYDCSTMSRIEPSPEKFIDEIIRIRRSMGVRNYNDSNTSTLIGDMDPQVDPRLSNFIPISQKDGNNDDVSEADGGENVKRYSEVEYANVLNGRMIGDEEGSSDYVNLNPVEFKKKTDEEKVKKMNAFFGEIKDTATDLETQIFTSLISGRDIRQPVARQPTRQQQKGRRSLNPKNQKHSMENQTTGPALLIHDLARVKKWAINGMEGGMNKLKNLNKSIENLASTKPSLDWSSWKRKLMKVVKGPQGNYSNKSSSFVVDTFGVPIHMCPMSSAHQHQHIPALVEFCVGVVESLGISNKGIYRIPGNNAGVNELLAELNKDPDLINFENDRWMDVNVVGSLLKLFFRKLPDPLMPSALYCRVILIARSSNQEKKLLRLKSILNELPITNRETFKFLANHLHKVADNQAVNKMNAHNLAIMFGPSLVHPQHESTNQMIADMNMQTHIVELIIIYSNWLFSDWSENPNIPTEEGGTALQADNNVNNFNNLQLLPSTEALLALKSKDLDLETQDESSSMAFIRQGILRMSNRSNKLKNKLIKADSSSSSIGEAVTNQIIDEEKEVMLKRLDILTRSYHVWKNREVINRYDSIREKPVTFTAGDNNSVGGGGGGGGSSSSSNNSAGIFSNNSNNLKRNLTKKYASNELEISAPINNSYPSLIEKQNSEIPGINREDSFSSIKRYPAYSFKNSTITSNRDGRGDGDDSSSMSKRKSKVSISSSSSSLYSTKKDTPAERDNMYNYYVNNNNNNNNSSIPVTNSDPFLSRGDFQQQCSIESESSSDGRTYSSRRKESFIVNDTRGRRYFVPSSTDSVSLFFQSSSRPLSRSQVRDSIKPSANPGTDEGDYQNFDVIARSLPIPSLYLETKSDSEIPICKYTERRRAY